MKRIDVLQEIQRFFKICELVCPDVFDKFGERAWQFLSTDLLSTLLIVRRDILQVPLIANNSNNTQRGLRCNICNLNRRKTLKGELYLSAHSLGMAVDLSSAKMTAEEMRRKIAENVEKLPCNIRIESDVNWLHIDVYDSGGTDKIVFFNE